MTAATLPGEPRMADAPKTGLVVEDLPEVAPGSSTRSRHAFPGIEDLAKPGISVEVVTPARRHTPDIALIDLGLPDGSGTDG